MGIPRRKLADMAPGADSPLNFAITQQDQSTLALVQEAICLLYTSPSPRDS